MAAAPLILFLTGWGGSFRSVYGESWSWRAHMAGREILPVELPGHADPAASGNPGDYGDLAGCVARALPAARIDIIAFSLGAKVALELALRHPDRVRKLALGGVGDNLFAVEPAAEAIALALEHGIAPDTSLHARAMVAYGEASGSNPRALAAVLRRPANPSHSPARMAALSCPTLLVNGDMDTVAVPDARLLASSPRFTGVRLPGVNHVDLPGEPAFADAAFAHLSPEAVGLTTLRVEAMR